MTFELACDIPRDVYLSCSGGIDSMFALDFLLSGRKRPTLVHFNHGTPHAKDAEEFVSERARELAVELIVKRVEVSFKDGSKEEVWRHMRYEFLNSLPKTVITAHQLNEAAEWWIMSSLHGRPSLTPVVNKNVIRPFLFVPRSEIERWCVARGVRHVDDPSNASMKHPRNVVRHAMMPFVQSVNPGILKTVKKLYVSR